jgi:flagellar FliJ protein
MKRFKFRFEKILTFRRHQEKQKQRELASAQNMEQKQKDKLTAIADDFDACQDDEKKYLLGKINPNRLTEYSRYFLLLKRMELSGREILQQISREVGKKRDELIGATRRKKIYEKLKERHQEKHILELNRLIQKENDEIGQTHR